MWDLAGRFPVVSTNPHWPLIPTWAERLASFWQDPLGPGPRGAHGPGREGRAVPGRVSAGPSVRMGHWGKS